MKLVADKSFIGTLIICMFSKVRKMRKTTVLLLVLGLAFVPVAVIRQAKADITAWTWLPPYISKIDNSYVIYEHGSTASLLVPVYNHLSSQMNVSKVIIAFDINKNKTLDLSASPKQIKVAGTEYFTVSFTADAAEMISSSMQHTYTVYVEHLNSTGGLAGTLQKAWNAFSPYWRFIVYSTDQADVLELSAEHSSYASKYLLTWFTRADALLMAAQAQTEASLAAIDYTTHNNYGSAKTRYTTAIDLYSQAIALQNAYNKSVQDATDNRTLTANAVAMLNASAAVKLAEAAQTEANAKMVQANATVKQADAALTNAYGFYFIGLGFALGWSFMGIGVIIYAWRKPKPAA